MLVIRREQLDSFARFFEESFTYRAIAHIRQSVPELATTWGDDYIRDFVLIGLEKARAYRLETERDVMSYLNLMLFLGADFDTDRALGWARLILTDSTMAAKTRMELLTARANLYLRRQEVEEGGDDA